MNKKIKVTIMACAMVLFLGLGLVGSVATCKIDPPYTSSGTV